MAVSESHLKVLRHMLGLTDPYRREQVPYRDYYCANQGDVLLHEMEEAGLVRRYRCTDGYESFCTTERGRREGIKSALARRKGPAARRYARFLDLRDVVPDVTFREFLTRPEFAELRRLA